MAGTERIDHSKSSWQSLLMPAGVLGFVLFERADIAAETRRSPREAHYAYSWQSLAALGCASAVLYGGFCGTPRLAGSLFALMVGYGLFLKSYPSSSGHLVGEKAPWGGTARPDGDGSHPQSPCPPGQMWDVENQACVSEPLPWPIGPRTGYGDGWR
jgi:hypothetical protein